MKLVEPWFQVLNNGHRQGQSQSSREINFTPGYDGYGGGGCLWLATQSEEEVRILIEVIQQFFPERACSCRGTTKLIHFNNHPDTTWDQIEKVMAEAVARIESNKGGD